MVSDELVDFHDLAIDLSGESVGFSEDFILGVVLNVTYVRRVWSERF